MDSKGFIGSCDGLVISSTTSRESRKISNALVTVKTPVALQDSENAFIEKTLHYISSIEGSVKSGLVLSTNTKLPSRYIIIIRGMPLMRFEDFKAIRDMNDHIRDIQISTCEELIRIDVWRTGKKSTTKKKRKRQKDSVVTNCDLSSVDDRDRKCIKQLLLKLNAMHEVECQFQVRVDTSIPDFYQLELNMLDSLSLYTLETILHECRTFCTDFEFDFPHKLIRAKCLKVTAPLRRRQVLTIK